MYIKLADYVIISRKYTAVSIRKISLLLLYRKYKTQNCIFSKTSTNRRLKETKFYYFVVKSWDIAATELLVKLRTRQSFT